MNADRDQHGGDTGNEGDEKTAESGISSQSVMFLDLVVLRDQHIYQK